MRVRRWRNLHFREAPQTRLDVVRVDDPAFKRPLLVAWDGAGAKAPDTACHPMIEAFADATSVLSDEGFHAKEGDPRNLKLCRRGTWNTRLLVETVLSLLTGVCHLQKVLHRTWAAFQARLAFTLAAFNLLVQWHGFKPDSTGVIRLSLAEFSL